MVKFLPYYKHLTIFFICCALSASAFSQSKTAKEASKKEAKGKETKGGELSNFPGASVISDKPAEKTFGNESFTFLVLINPNDEGAVKQWADLPSTIPGLKIEVLSGKDNAYILVSKNPQMGLFKRAFSGFFQIFSESDLEMYSSALPCLGELRPEIANLAKKMSSN